jgi:site-specific DNA-methyltransferase (adenine-specific)
MGKAWDTFVPDNVSKAVETNTDSFKKNIESKQDNPNLKGRKNSPIGSNSTVAGTYDLSDKGKNDYQQWCYEWGKECFRVLKPGGHLLASNSPRMYHRMAIGLEDAGFEIRDQIMWVYGSGFPKSHNIGKAIDKIEGNEREVVGEKKNKINLNATKEGDKSFYENAWQNKDYIDLPITKGNNDWEGWGTALKPAHEPIVMARKPLSEKSIAENVLKHGTGGINIDGSRIGMKQGDKMDKRRYNEYHDTFSSYEEGESPKGKEYIVNEPHEGGRFPANIIFDEEAGQLLDEQSGITQYNKERKPGNYKGGHRKEYVGTENNKIEKKIEGQFFNDKGGASRFFYCPKSSKKDRNEGLDEFEDKHAPRRDDGQPYGMNTNKFRPDGSERKPVQPKKNNHPTVKPTDLMRYLINLITPPNGVVLDPFMGSGSTGKAAVRCGLNFIGIEKEQEYMDIAKARIEHEKNKPVQTKLL